MRDLAQRRGSSRYCKRRVLRHLRSGSGPVAVILAGIAGSQLFHALTSLVVTKSAPADEARGIMF